MEVSREIASIVTKKPKTVSFGLDLLAVSR